MFPDAESDVAWPSVAVIQDLLQDYHCGVIHVEGVPTLNSPKISHEIKEMLVLTGEGWCVRSQKF